MNAGINISRDKVPQVLAAVIIILTAFLIFSKISLNGLHYFDDAYYAQKAKEMLRSGNLWVASYAGRQVYDNPPMHFWILAAMFKAAGINEFSARFSSAVFVLLIMLLGYRMAVFVFKDKWAGFFAVFVLALTNYVTRQAFRSMLDVTLVFFEMTSLYLFMLANDRKKAYFFMLAGIFTGFAVLTKSVMGLYPAVIIFMYYIFSGNAARLLSAGPWIYIASAAAVFLPWYAVSYYHAGPAFFSSHFGWLIGGMAFGEGEARRIHFTPAYIKVMFSYGLPWMPLAVYGTYVMIKQEWKKSSDNIFIILPLAAWIIMAALSFTSIAKTWYVLPAFTACSMICGYLLFKWIKQPEKFARISTVAYALIALVLVILPVSLNSKKSNEIKAMAPFVRTLVPEGKKVINYRMPYWVLSNPLIFYTDREPTESVETREELFKALDAGGIAMAYAKYYDADLASGYSGLITEIARAGDKVLFCKKGRIESIKTPVYSLPKP